MSRQTSRRRWGAGVGTFLSLYCKTDIRSVLLGREEAGQTHGQEAVAEAESCPAPATRGPRGPRVHGQGYQGAWIYLQISTVIYWYLRPGAE